MSANLVIPSITYADAYLDGEQFGSANYRLPPDDPYGYRQVLSLEAFRAEFMGRQWGLVPVFLPHFAATLRRSVPGARHLLALTLLHDVEMWPGFTVAEEVYKTRRAKAAFGVVDAEFVPYWRSQDLVRAQQALVSVYRQPGRALLVVANLAESRLVERLGLEPEELGLGSAAATGRDAITGEPVTLANGRLEVEIEPYSFLLIDVSSAGE